MTSKLIILDRDGVINEDSDEYIKSPDEWIPIPGSLEAIARLNRAEYRLLVASNQSGLARGYFDYDTLSQIHEKMHRMLAVFGGRVDAVYFCPHGPDDHCQCRKPKPGLFEDIARRTKSDLTGVPAVGDSLRDLDAARALKCAPVLVRTGKGKATEAKGKGLDDVPVYDDLASYVADLLARDG